MIREDEPAITFMDEDVRQLHRPHDDAIVITLTIANYPAFQQMRINKELFRLVNVPLIGFGGLEVLLVGTIFLPVVVGSYPRQINKKVNFLVVDCSSSYNAIIGPPTDRKSVV